MSCLFVVNCLNEGVFVNCPSIKLILIILFYSNSLDHHWTLFCDPQLLYFLLKENTIDGSIEFGLSNTIDSHTLVVQWEITNILI